VTISAQYGTTPYQIKQDNPFLEVRDPSGSFIMGNFDHLLLCPCAGASNGRFSLVGDGHAQLFAGEEVVVKGCLEQIKKPCFGLYYQDPAAAFDCFCSWHDDGIYQDPFESAGPGGVCNKYFECSAYKYKAGSEKVCPEGQVSAACVAMHQHSRADCCWHIHVLFVLFRASLTGTYLRYTSRAALLAL
jgi:hypothetical protein